MKQVINTERIPIKLWLDDIEEGALEQAKNLANLPFAYKWVSIMPDSHQGYGMPIGGVLATKDVIIPNAVGKDIGCGMCAVKTNLKKIENETLKKIMSKIRENVPVGAKHQTKRQNEMLMPTFKMGVNPLKYRIVNNEWEKALYQLGTLGGGNHFIEIQKGSDGYIWIMIHSGSRNIGKQVADYYNLIATKLNEKWNSGVPKSWDLAFLPVDSVEGEMYIAEMNYCVEFALANRKLMMDRIKDIFKEVYGYKESYKNEYVESNEKEYVINVEFDDMINIAHNYASLENHFGENVWVHRKGATLAREGTIGIIPGSQGTKSYIVKGKGNPESFESCSHGAGRKMGRKQAQKDLDFNEEVKKLNEKGIIHSVRNVKDLDEAPGSYKDIDVVMKNQEDLVEVLVELHPLGVVKG